MSGYDLTLYKNLKPHLRVCRLTGKKDELIVRCPHCGDSKKDPNKGHFYIQNRPPFKYFCQRCTTNGILTQKVLQKIGVNDYNITSMLSRNLKDYKKKLSYKYGSEIGYLNNKDLNFSPNQYGYLENEKIEYLNERLGIQLQEKDIDRFKLILNFEDFITKNDIDISKRVKNKRDEELIYKLHNYCIGFLTTDRNTIIFRSLDEGATKFRYHNYSLFPDAIESKKFFSVKKNLDLSLSKHKIIMTEGILDVLGVYNNILNRDDEPLYVSTNGKSFLFVLDHLASLSLLNVDIDIYSDTDVGLGFYKNYIMRESNLAKFNGLNIYYNKIGKDYGVPKSKIDISKEINLF